MDVESGIYPATQTIYPHPVRVAPKLHDLYFMSSIILHNICTLYKSSGADLEAPMFRFVFDMRMRPWNYSAKHRQGCENMVTNALASRRRIPLWTMFPTNHVVRCLVTKNES
jgi:hypothetical protein